MKSKTRSLRHSDLIHYLIFALILTSCGNPLAPSSLLPPGFHPGIPTTGSSSTPGMAPTITSVVPSSGPMAGGTTLTVNGTGFTNGISILLGGLSCTSVNLVSANQLTCLTPAHSMGENSLTVTNPDLLTASLANAFFFTGSGTSSPTFVFAVGGGFSSAAGIKFRGTAGAMSGSPSLTSGGNVRAYTGIQSVLTKP